jgi:hypothetical protein
MSHIKARVDALRELVDEIKNAETIFERASLFAAIRGLADDLTRDENLNGYAKEKADGIRYHTAAALGFDFTGGHDAEAHRVWAYGEMNTLETAYE